MKKLYKHNTKERVLNNQPKINWRKDGTISLVNATSEDKVVVNKVDLFQLLDYVSLMNEKSDYEASGKSKNHIWLPIRRIIKQVKYRSGEGMSKKLGFKKLHIFEFSIVLNGVGENKQKAWDNAVESFMENPGEFSEIKKSRKINLLNHRNMGYK